MSICAGWPLTSEASLHGLEARLYTASIAGSSHHSNLLTVGEKVVLFTFRLSKKTILLRFLVLAFIAHQTTEYFPECMVNFDGTTLLTFRIFVHIEVNSYQMSMFRILPLNINRVIHVRGSRF